MTHAILRLPAVKSRTGLSRSSLYLAMSRGEFPRAIHIGRHAVGWLESDIQRWIDERIAHSQAAESRSSPAHAVA
jgi:prophage regulatory protein